MLAALCLSLALAPVAQAGAAPSGLAVVVASSHEVKEMSVASVTEVFVTRRQFWADRRPVTLVLLADDAPLHRAFCEQVLHRDPADLARIYLQQRYRGQLSAKVVRVADVAELAKVVAGDPTAIGYLPSAAVKEGLRAVLTVGAPAATPEPPKPR